MEYKGMTGDERLVSVTPPERDTEGMGMPLEQIIMTAYSEMKLATGN